MMIAEHIFTYMYVYTHEIQLSMKNIMEKFLNINVTFRITLRDKQKP